MKKDNIKCVFGNGFIISNEDMKKIKEPLEKLEVLLSFNDLGKRDFFQLISKKSGKIYSFKNGKLEKQD